MKNLIMIGSVFAMLIIITYQSVKLMHYQSKLTKATHELVEVKSKLLHLYRMQDIPCDQLKFREGLREYRQDSLLRNLMKDLEIRKQQLKKKRMIRVI